MAVPWQWVDTPDRPVRVRDSGPVPGGPTLLVLPGLGALGYLVPFLDACARWARTLLLDLPGFGHPATSGCPAALRDVATDTTAVLDALELGPVVAVGHSTGAQALLRVALARPGEVSVCALLGPTFPPSLRRWPPLVAAALRTVAGEPRRLRLAAGTITQYLRGRSGVGELLRSCAADAPEECLSELRAPTVILRGRRDAVCPAPWASRLAGAAGGVAVTLPGSHNVVSSHPELVAAVLRDAVTVPARG